MFTYTSVCHFWAWWHDLDTDKHPSFGNSSGICKFFFKANFNRKQNKNKAEKIIIQGMKIVLKSGNIKEFWFAWWADPFLVRTFGVVGMDISSQVKGQKKTKKRRNYKIATPVCQIESFHWHQRQTGCPDQPHIGGGLDWTSAIGWRPEPSRVSLSLASASNVAKNTTNVRFVKPCGSVQEKSKEKLLSSTYIHIIVKTWKYQCGTSHPHRLFLSKNEP